MRPCGGCGKTKPTTEFYRRRGRPYSPCKSCRCAAARSRYHATMGELEQLRQYRTIVAAVQAQVPYLGGDLA